MDGETPGKVRDAVAAMAPYRPGKAASQAEEEHGISNAIKLASNENPWSPVPAVVAAIKVASTGVNRYGDNGATDLRHAIGEWIDVDPSWITIGCGSSGVLQQVMFSYVDAGDEVVFPWPSFEIYPVFSKLFDATDVRVDLDGYGFDLDAVAAAVSDRTKVVFLATPNNPTGASISTASVAVLLDAIPDDVMVVIDEAYREFNEPQYGDPVRDLLADRPNLIVTRTFSKAFGLAGLRVGYGVAHPGVISLLDRTRLAFSVNNAAQAGAIAAIEHEAEAMVRVAELIDERTRVVEILEAGNHPIGPANANFVFLPTGDDTDRIAYEMEREGVVVRPFPGFGMRVTIGTPAENDRWLAAFQKAVAGG
ncbi:MAG: histidinol-phosphate transaminase [Acidimicrobiales bacterium]